VFSFIETRVFSRLVQEYLSDDEYRALQAALIENPEAGPAIPGSGGVRKLRWPAARTRQAGRVSDHLLSAANARHHLDADDVPEECRWHDPRRCAEKDP